MSQPTEVSYPVGPLPEDARESVAAIMREVGLANLSIRVLRRRLETKYKLEFTSHKEKIQEIVDELMGTKEFKKEMALIHKGTEEAAKSKKAPKASKATSTKVSSKKERSSSKTEKAAKEPRVAKEKKPDNYPKAALTGYFIFMNEKRAEIKAANPTSSVAELGKISGNMWKEVSETERQRYNDLAAADKKRFEREMESFESAGGEKIKRGGKKDKKKGSKKTKKDGPKRATSAFMLFLNGKRKEINDANPGLKMTQLPKIASDMWKSLTPEESAPWHELAAKDKERYLKECAEGGTTKAPAKKRSKTEAAAASSSSSSDSDSSSDSSSDSDSDSSSDSSSSSSSSSDSD